MTSPDARDDLGTYKYPPMRGHLPMTSVTFEGISPEAASILTGMKEEHFVKKPDRSSFFPGSAPAVVQQFQRTALELVVQKDAAYGGAWKDQGYMGNVARILSKVDRLRHLLWNDKYAADPQSIEPAEDETVLDTLLDLANLCALAAENISEANRWGRSG